MKWFAQLENEIGPLLLPQDISNIIQFIINQPQHVHLDNVHVRPTRQKI